jgi:hypothetical protein
VEANKTRGPQLLEALVARLRQGIGAAGLAGSLVLASAAVAQELPPPVEVPSASLQQRANELAAAHAADLGESENDEGETWSNWGNSWKNKA